VSVIIVAVKTGTLRNSNYDTTPRFQIGQVVVQNRRVLIGQKVFENMTEDEIVKFFPL